MNPDNCDFLVFDLWGAGSYSGLFLSLNQYV